MFGRPVVITSLEEDLKALGLLKEEGPEKPGPSGEPSSSKAAPGRNVGALSDDPDEKGSDTTKKVEPHAGAVPEKKSLPVTPGAQSESIRGMLDKVRAGGSGKAKKESRDYVSELLADVSGIMEGIDDSHREDSVKAFANMSIISDMLYRGYSNLAEKYENEDLIEAANALAEMSQEAHDIASDIEAGEEVDEDIVSKIFSENLEALVAGLDLYADLAEEDAKNDEEEEDDDKDDDKKKSKKDDEEEEDEPAKDEKDEAILPRSPLVGRDKNMKGRGVGASSGAGSAVKSTPGMRLNMSVEGAREEGRGPLPGSVLVKKNKGAASGAGSAVKSTPGMRLNMSTDEGKE